MRLSHNTASLNVYRSYAKALEGRSGALDKISSGNKINRACDNPNAMAQSEKMRIQIRGMQMAQRNMQDGISMLQTAEGGLDGMTGMLQRMRELTVQAGNETNTPEDRKVIQSEVDQMLQGVDNFADGTEFNGVKLLKINAGDTNTVLEMTTGANTDEKIQINRFNLTSSGDLKLVDAVTGKSNVDVTTPAGVDKVLETLDNAINTVISVRSEYGALENRFESATKSSSEIEEKLSAADGDLTETDIAEQMMEYAKHNILVEAGNAMMVQSNRFPQDILRILDRR